MIMGMHIGILTVVNFADLTIGVMMIHLFTFDPNWFRPRKKQDDKKIVLFDGVCGLCNGWVNFLIENDVANELKFSPLQGSFAKHVCEKGITNELGSIVFFTNGKTYTKSKAVIMILCQLGGIWIFPSLLLITPKVIRDLFYDLIAKNRYKIFGKLERCRMPTPGEKLKFIE